MKNIKFLTLLLFVFTSFFTSCDLDNIKLPDNNINRLKWTYSIGEVSINTLPNPIPAIDEEGNIYAYISSRSKDNLIKLNSLGQKIWSRNAGSVSSRIIYSNHKVFYAIGTSIACSDSDTGTELWKTDNAINGNIFAVSKNRVYTTDFRESDVLGINYLKAFDLEGNEIWKTKLQYSPTDTFSFPYAMSINDSDIYIGVLAEVGKSNFAILKYHDNDNNAIKSWAWLAPEGYNTDGVSGRFNDIAIDDSANLLFSMNENSTQYVFSLSPEGNENWHAKTSQEKVISSLTVDKSGNAFSSYSTTEKTGSNGAVWNTKLKEDWEFEGFSSKGPALSNEGNSYSFNFSKLLTAIDNSGKILWEQHYEPGEDTGLSSDEQFHNITINRNGDIIIIGKFEIKCFKGDGSGLLNGGWPKLYGNYGNTSSK